MSGCVCVRCICELKEDTVVFQPCSSKKKRERGKKVVKVGFKAHSGVRQELFRDTNMDFLKFQPFALEHKEARGGAEHPQTD